MVSLVADGLGNGGVAVELGPSGHTIRKYLLRIFDKVGISSRVELVLCALSHGEHRPPMDAEQRLRPRRTTDGYNGYMRRGEESGR